MPPFRQPKVFVSATSRGLKGVRQAAADQLRGRGVEVIVQEEFEGDHQMIQDLIRDQLSPCDAVVLLVGPAYGFEPTGWPDNLPRRSYTQLEYDLAVELGIPVYRFLATATFPLTPFDPEPTDHQQRQREYVAHLKAQDHIWYEFASEPELLALLDKTRFHVRITPNLPFASIGTLFKGRADELTAVRKSLRTRPAHATAVTSKQAVHGLGGVGKTRFTVEYAHRYRTEYSAVLYASADTPASLAANVAALAHVLHLPEAEETEQAKQVEAVERWLRAHAGWLLILDNVDTVEAQAAVNALFPKLAAGHVLVTSRLASGWADGVSAVELDTLAIPAATEFLLDRTARDPAVPTKPARQLSPTDPTDATELATYLGGLALALEQAGAYVCQHAITFAEYRSRLTAVESKVLEWFDADVMKYPKSVAVTWQASADELTDDGRALLHLLCWLAPDPIPVSLIRTEPTEPPHTSIKSREKALRQLQDYSLAKGNADGGSVTVHRLVQDVTRARLAEPTRTHALTDALGVADGYGEGDPLDPRTSIKWGAFRPHAQALVLVAPEAAHPIRAGRLFNRLALSVLSRGDRTAAEQLSRRAIAILDRANGLPAGDAASAVNTLAMTLQGMATLVETGRRAALLTAAEPHFRKAVELAERNPVADDGSVAIYLNNLAGCLVELGHLEESTSLYEQALARDRSLFGDSHPRVASRLNNLGMNHFRRRRFDAAQAAFEEAIRIYDAATDYDPNYHATVCTNLARVHEIHRRRADAERFYRSAVEVTERAPEADTPRIGVRLHNLAVFLINAGRAAEAIPILDRAIPILERYHGPDHALTVSARQARTEILRRSGSSGAPPVAGGASAKPRRSSGWRK